MLKKTITLLDGNNSNDKILRPTAKGCPKSAIQFAPYSFNAPPYSNRWGFTSLNKIHCIDSCGKPLSQTDTIDNHQHLSFLIPLHQYPTHLGKRSMCTYCLVSHANIYMLMYGNAVLFHSFGVAFSMYWQIKTRSKGPTRDQPFYTSTRRNFPEDGDKLSNISATQI